MLGRPLSEPLVVSVPAERGRGEAVAERLATVGGTNMTHLQVKNGLCPGCNLNPNAYRECLDALKETTSLMKAAQHYLPSPDKLPGLHGAIEVWWNLGPDCTACQVWGESIHRDAR